jgi:hypothetical protein
MTEEKNTENNNETPMFDLEEHRHEGDKVSSITFALILIWAGLVFLGSNFGWLDQLNFVIDETWNISSIRDWTQFGVWNLVALGAGGIVLLGALARLAIPEYRRNIGGALIMAALFIGIGLGGWYSWNYLWPMIIIAIGINALIKGLASRR